MKEQQAMLGAGAAGQAAAALMEAKVQAAEELRQHHAQQRLAAPQMQHQQALLAARDAERLALRQQYERADAAIVERYDAALRAQG